MPAIVVSVHDVLTGSSTGAHRVAAPRSVGHGQMGMDYRVAWAAGETMERLFSNISHVAPMTNMRMVDVLNITGQGLAARFLNECLTVPGERALRGIVNRCLKPQHEIYLIVPHVAFRGLLAGGRNHQDYARVFRNTGATVYVGSRTGQRLAFEA